MRFSIYSFHTARPLPASEAENRSGRAGARVHVELLVRVFEMLAHRLRRDPEKVSYLVVGSPFGDVRKHLSLTWRQRLGSSRCRRSAPRGADELAQVRSEQVEHTTVAFAEVALGAIELEPRAAARFHVEPQHVLDTEWAVDVHVELPPPKLPQ
jgi:hypothetical protein